MRRIQQVGRQSGQDVHGGAGDLGSGGSGYEVRDRNDTVHVREAVASESERRKDHGGDRKDR